MTAADANRTIRSCFTIISLCWFTAKPPGKMEKNRRLCLSAPTVCLPQCFVGAVEPECTIGGAHFVPKTSQEKGDARSNKAIIHPRFAAWYNPLTDLLLMRPFY